MKTIFNTIDVASIVNELKSSIIGLRVNQIYDIDHKTYLIKLQKPEVKTVLLIESATRIHTTEYEWPKNPAPSGFSMKLRKHLRNKRVESIEQLGVDRIVDLTFGSGEAVHHLIAELYDRGNIILTDADYVILNVLRPRKDGEDTKIIVHQKYPLESVRKARSPPSLLHLQQVFGNAKANTALKKLLNPLLDCGGSILEHELLRNGFQSGTKLGQNFDPEKDLDRVLVAVSHAQSSVLTTSTTESPEGFIIKKHEQRAKADGEKEDIFLYQEFHPRLYQQHENLPNEKFVSFNAACDEFFSKLEANELDKKVLQKEKEALKRLENVRTDHAKRLQELQQIQEVDRKKGQLIELNQDLVEGALLVLRSAIANQIDWKHIEELIKEAQSRSDPIASTIKNLKLQMNSFTMWLSDPYDYDENDMLLDSDEEREEGTESGKMRPMAVDIDLDLSALANARKYYNLKRQAAKKQQKTIDASFKAIKSAEKKTHQTLKEVSAIASINKARKVHWFEKYLWFVSSENYLVIGGRDSQQNEQIVKRHLRPKDVYVHADLHGAASVIIKNPTSGNVPPRSLHEAGIMALCYSRAWDEKVVTSAWWVWGQQVSKTAPAGEYLTTGAFMVRGKKNFLPPSHHIYGFGFLFRLEDCSIERHAGERKVRSHNDDGVSSALSDALDKLSMSTVDEKDIDLPIDDDIEDDSDEESQDKLASIKEDQENESSPSGTQEKDAIGKEDATSSADEVEQEFPDTVVEISHLKGDQFTLKAHIAEPQSTNLSEDQKSQRVVFLGDDQPVVVGAKHGTKDKKGKSKESTKSNFPKTEEQADDNRKGASLPKDGTKVMKRGHKGKLKKMKKYKDQDEEEREMVMQLLQSSGTKKSSKKDKSGKKEAIKSQKPKIVQKSGPPPNQKPTPPSQTTTKTDVAEEEAEDDEANQVPDDLTVLNALTAVPVTEDELLYAIPVCAPYTSMVNYKFRVKLTPGNGKKGKACKTALNLFLSDKSTSVREKDLLRAVKDYDLAKNIPGKVKVSAPNIQKVKK